MAEQDAYPTSTQNVNPLMLPVKDQPNLDPTKVYPTFPYPNAVDRLKDYEYFWRIFMGDHFGAFNIRIGDVRYTREYSKLRYVMINLAGLISKVVADMLFSETPTFSVPDGDQEFLDALVFENNLHIQNYESALSNSYLGDALYRIRVGKRHPNNENPTVILEDVTPRIYFPHVDGFNVRAVPAEQELAWTFVKDGKTYLRQEIHLAGKIVNKVWLLMGDSVTGAATGNFKLVGEVPLAILGDPDLTPEQETEINHNLLTHVPNWKTGNRYFGISDYHDLTSIFYAVNNRMTKVDNILDKHSDPILMVPPGVLDEKGNVRKKALGVIEVGEGEAGKPEYIVWDASLDNAYKEIKQLIEFLFMTSEISPDILGMGTGQSDSGRALKLKVLRTIAKVARKKLYYDKALKDVLYKAQLVAKAHNLEVGGLKLKAEPVVPEIEWADGLPVDNAEQVDIETKRLDAGNTTIVDSIIRLDGVDEETAQRKAKEIKEEGKIELPQSKLSNTFGPNDKKSMENQMKGGGNNDGQK